MTVQQYASFDVEAAQLNSPSSAISTLVKAWESKNAKRAAKGTSFTLMAVSLAACGGGSAPAVDTTPFAQSDIDNAVAAVDTSSDDDAAILAAVQAVDATATTVQSAITKAEYVITADIVATVNSTYGLSLPTTSTGADIIAAVATAGAAVADIATVVTVNSTYGLSLPTTSTGADIIAAVAAAGAATVDITTDNADAVTAALTLTSATPLALTSGTDTIIATAADDTFNASVSATAAENTLSNIDTLSGGDGIDTANIVVSVLAVDIGVSSVGMTSIETIKIRSIDSDGTVATHAATFNAGLATGITSVSSDRSTSNLTVTGLAAGASVGMIGNGSLTNGILSYAYNTAASAQIINIDGGTIDSGNNNITATASTGVTTATINSTGASNKIDTIKLDSAGANTVTSLTVNATSALAATLTASDFATTAIITVTGAGAVDLGTNANVKIVDATTHTGGLTVASGTNTTSLTGGTGNDTITSAAIGAAAVINAGDGTDTLIVSNVSDVDTALEAAKYTNFETLRLNGTLDVSLVSGISALEVSGATNSITELSATQAAAVKATADIGATTFALEDSTGTSDALNLTMGTGLTTSEATDITTLTANGFETINIAANAGPTASAANKLTEVNAFGADVVTAINLTGTNFTLADVATTLAVTIDATALTGNGAASSLGLTAGGSAFAGSTVRGSEFVDDFTIGAAGSTYQGNGGEDIFLSTTEGILVGSVAIDGGAAADTLSMSALAATLGAQTIGDTMFSKLNSIENVNFTGANAGDFTWTLGGFANALATSNGGVLKTVAANFATAVTADVVTVDASSLTGTNALELTLTNTVGIGSANAATHVFTGGGGNDKLIISFDKNHANDQSVITISGGGGADTITFSMGTGTSAPGTITLSGGTGADTITGSVEIDTITGGAGVDTMTGGTGADIFVVTAVTDSNAATAGAIDKITDFAGGSDELKVVAATELNSETITLGYSSADTIAELNALLNSTSGTATTAKFDGTGEDAAKLTLNDGRILVAVDADASGTFTALDVVVELTGLTGTLVAADIIA